MKTLKKQLFPIWDRFIDILLPRRCYVSGEIIESNQIVSAEVWQDLHFLSEPECDHCGLPFEFEIEGRHLCLDCEQAPPNYDQARALLRYEETSRPIILGFKHGDQTHMAPILGQMMAGRARCWAEQIDYIIPVPLHYRRLVKRRYNQASLLAKPIAQTLQKPVLHEALKRMKNTAPQGHQSRAERHSNMAGAFDVEAGMAEALKGRNILLIDDVLTSGATVNQCAKTLKKYGADKVFVLCLARA